VRVALGRVGLWVGALAVLAIACAAQDRAPYPPRLSEPTRLVWVVGHEWHTGLVIRRADIPDGLWPEHGDFVGAEYLEVGWGDREFYQATAPTLSLGLRAAVGANPGVLHVVAFSDAIGAVFPRSQIVELSLSTEGLAALCSFVHAAHARDETGRAMALGPGLYGWSRFYLGRERYAFPETCNTWTARALRAAGLPIKPWLAQTSHGLMSQVVEAAACQRRP
jgi:uncharacterized protein (TIGR02117 family)